MRSDFVDRESFYETNGWLHKFVFTMLGGMCGCGSYFITLQDNHEVMVGYCEMLWHFLGNAKFSEGVYV